MDSLEEHLEAGASRVRGARAAAVVGRDGLLVARGGPEAEATELPRVAAEATDLLAAAERTLDVAPEDAPGRAVTVRDAAGAVHLHVFGHDAFLLWWLRDDAEPEEAADASEALASELAEAMP